MNREVLEFAFFRNLYKRTIKVRKENTDIHKSYTNDLCYEIKFGNHVKNKNNFFIKQNLFFFGKIYIFKISKNSVASKFVCRGRY